MKIKRIVGAAVIAALGLATLTACDPPYPPDLVETIYEQNPVCDSGVTRVLADAKLSGLVANFNDTMTVSCPELSLAAAVDNPNMFLTVDEELVHRDNVFAATPLFADAGVAAITFADGSSLNLGLETLFKILAGEITVWNDPVIQKENKNSVIPETAIIVNPVADEASLKSLVNWAKLCGIKVSDNLLTRGEKSPIIDPFSEGEGSISIIPLSEALAAGVIPAAIKVSSKHLKATVAPSDTTVFAAASQFKSKVVNGALTLELDPTISPELPKGADAADVPYQAVFFGWQVFVGKDNLKDRAVGRFLLRMDEQGTLPTASLIGLPSKIRQASTKLISVGLKLPKVTIKK